MPREGDSAPSSPGNIDAHKVVLNELLVVIY